MGSAPLCLTLELLQERFFCGVKFMKNTVKLFIIALCALMLFGCSSTASKPEPKTSSSEQQSTLEILTTAKTAAKFTSEQVSEDHIKQILSAGLNAPSARNSQPWHFSVVTDKEILNQINEAMTAGMPKGGPGGPGGPRGKPEGEKSGNKQPPSDKQPSNAGIPPKKLGLSDAAVAIFVYGTNKMPTDSFDCGLATEAMSVAALSLGYGTKIVSSPSIALNGEKQADFDKLLQIPEGYSNVAVLLIGCNDESVDATTRASTRNTMDEKVKFIE
jgi:nitroreductase